MSAETTKLVPMRVEAYHWLDHLILHQGDPRAFAHNPHYQALVLMRDAYKYDRQPHVHVTCHRLDFTADGASARFSVNGIQAIDLAPGETTAIIIQGVELQ